MKTMQILAALAALATILSTAHADESFRRKHPRRAQVLHKDKRLQNATENAEKNGKITQDQANQLEGQEAAVRKQEQAQAAANGGHITKAEQRKDNREENKIRRELRHDEKMDANGGANPSAPAGGAGNAPTTTQQ